MQSITVFNGSHISYTVSKENYETVTVLDYVVDETKVIDVSLVKEKAVFTLSVTPDDATVIVTVNGQAVDPD